MIHARLALLLGVLVVSPSWAENWPQWRGPKNDGVSTEKNLPTEWSEKSNILWKLEMPGIGSSTPCIWSDQLFFTSADDKGPSLYAMCVGTDGKERWRQKIGESAIKARGDEGNAASASPSTDGKHVWFFVGSGDVVCFDLAGKQVWTANMQKQYGNFRIQFGMHSTPVLFEGKLYLQMMHDGGQHICCLNAADGKEVWHINRPSDGRAECLHSYASPFMWTNGKESYLVCHGNDYATGHALADGKELWRLGGLNPKDKYNPTLRFVASPLCTPEMIVVPTAKNGAVVAIKPSATGKIEAGNMAELWRLPNGTPDVPSPLLHEGIVYLARENGFLTAVDAATGKYHYNQQRTYNDRHRASPVVADGKIYMASRNGTVTVVKAGTKFDLLATNKLPDDLTASPAISGGRIYLRGFKYLYAIGNK